MNKLYDFQQKGVDFMSCRYTALLGDEMGLGKTVQAISVCEKFPEATNLIVCLNTLKLNWEREIKKWAPDKSVTVITGTKAARRTKLEAHSDYTIINYEALRVFKDVSPKWNTVILDEAHKVKNRKAAVTLCVKNITRKSDRTYLLTGTPITNKASDLYSLLNIMEPDKYKSWWSFVNTYCHVYKDWYGHWVVEDFMNPKHPKVILLRNTLRTRMIRRLKTEVFPEMPKKIVTTMLVELNSTQRNLYNEMKKKMLLELDTGELVAAVNVVSQIVRLKQIAIDERLMVTEVTTPPLRGSKADTLLEIIESLGGKSLVVFSQFAKAIRSLKVLLDANNITCAEFTGDTSEKDRQIALDRFDSGEAQVFICTTQSGGTGLNLVKASTAVFLDKMWTPAANNQAQDRIHRIGMNPNEPATIIELIAVDTVEERIERILADKTRVITNLTGKILREII